MPHLGNILLMVLDRLEYKKGNTKHGFLLYRKMAFDKVRFNGSTSSLLEIYTSYFNNCNMILHIYSIQRFMDNALFYAVLTNALPIRRMVLFI